jgi:hypothetical protein
MNYRKAIVTGSVNYKTSPLKYPKNDIDLIESVLEKRCDIKKEDIKKILHKSEDEDCTFLEKIKSFCIEFNKEKTDAYDLVVFYYSGHGIFRQEENMSFLQIADDYYISINELIEIISEIKARNKYFIIDACQSGGFSLMTPKSKTNRQFTYNSTGIYCMFGTTKNLLAFEPTIKDVIKRKINNSFYTHFIAEALNKRSNYLEDTISIRVVDDYASKKTPTYTNFEQIPFSTTEIAGYFPFGFWKDSYDLDDIASWDLVVDDSDLYSSNQEYSMVNYLIDKIQKLFSENKDYVISPDKEILKNLSQPAKDILNDKLNLSNKKFEDKPLINGLISTENRAKKQFLLFILEQTDLNLDLSLKDASGKTVLYEAINNINFLPTYIIELLFIRGYKLTNEDENYVITEFNKQSNRPEILQNLAFTIACCKLSDIELIKKLKRIDRIVYSILSFKENKVIGYKLNHKALANNTLQNHKDFSKIFLKALKKYNYHSELLKTPSFSKKESSIIQEMPFQETDYDNVLSVLFPELFEE